MITGIPAYQTPLEQSLRCTCGARYIVFFGDGIGGAESGNIERAAALKAQYINAQLKPWLVCECGQVLDFMTEVSFSVQ
jgi:hypothetical protein